MLNVITVENAVDILKNKFRSLDRSEELPISLACGRIVSEDVTSPENVPPFSRSTMDGYAVLSSDTYGAGETLPAFLKVTGEVFMGENADAAVKSGECVRISTGGMLPEGADAVIPVERTEEENGECLVYAAVSPYENVTKAGDDLRAGECVIRKGVRLTPAHIGLLASCGCDKVKVAAKPKAGILSTGNEIAENGAKLLPGQIREVNSRELAALLGVFGCETVFYGTVKDEYEAISEKVKQAAAECDIVLISGGSSAGTKDMTVKVISENGEVFAHGLAMKPGKPTILGEISGKPVFGLPGHPAACYFVTEVIVAELIAVLLGTERKRSGGTYILTENISSNHGREEFVCVKTDGEKATPVYGKSGLLSVICSSDGYVRIDRNREGLKEGESVRVYPFCGSIL